MQVPGGIAQNKSYPIIICLLSHSDYCSLNSGGTEQYQRGESAKRKKTKFFIQTIYDIRVLSPKVFLAIVQIYSALTY